MRPFATHNAWYCQHVPIYLIDTYKHLLHMLSIMFKTEINVGVYGLNTYHLRMSRRAWLQRKPMTQNPVCYINICYHFHTKRWRWYSSQFTVNSLRVSDTYVHQHNIPTLLQITVWHLFGAKPLSEPMLPYCRLKHQEHISEHQEHISVKFYSKFENFIHGNALENVICEMVAILSQPQILC